eukprot:TRINITY_DN37901_c0_g1_i1.p1 TRINITY_DN37901_c0_g1~~TRINITY_DN37901_c0_g1_i1.p1  ORF type:complete len:282 (-),score=59.33 TRINITY_DN37901_c0_g1_i1:47-892(-)
MPRHGLASLLKETLDSWFAEEPGLDEADAIALAHHAAGANRYSLTGWKPPVLPALRRDQLWHTAFTQTEKALASAAAEGQADATGSLESNALDAAASGSKEEESQDPPPLWENVEGLPSVKVKTPAANYFSKDIADSNESAMKPLFGCKCGAQDWRPAPSHPSITFRKTFLDENPDFGEHAAKLHVNLVNTKTKKIQWDASYDLQRFRRPGAPPELTETMPAIPQSGKQLRFLTFCPDEPSEYEMQIDALDANDEKLFYFKDQVSRYTAQPARITCPHSQD